MLTFKEYYNPDITIIALVTDLSDLSDTHEYNELLCDIVTEVSGDWHNTKTLEPIEHAEWLKIAQAFDNVGYFHKITRHHDGSEYIETYFPSTDNHR